MLNNLNEFSSHGGVSLFSLNSPLHQTNQERTRSISLQDIVWKDQRAASKSITTTKLTSHQQKIQIRDRILNRIALKINSKCKKHYYAFFVILETIKKKNISLYDQQILPLTQDQQILPLTQDQQILPLTQDQQILPITHSTQDNVCKFVQKVQQSADLLFSKHFQTQLKVKAFQNILNQGKVKKFISIFEKIIEHKNKHQAFQSLQKYSQFIQTKIMKIQILIDSIENYFKKVTKLNIENDQKIKFEAFQTLKINAKSQRKIQSPTFTMKKLSIIKNLHHNNETNSIKISQEYIKIKNLEKSRESSPGKISKGITFEFPKKLTMNQSNNFTKCEEIKTNLLQISHTSKFELQVFQKVCHKLSVDLIIQNVSDMADQSKIFLDKSLSCNNQNAKKIQTNPIELEESHVSQYCHSNYNFSNSRFQDDYFSVNAHSDIDVPPKNQFDSRKSFQPLLKSSKTSKEKQPSFGSEAVNFKNSMIEQRQSFKQSQYKEKSNNSNNSKMTSFSKIKKGLKIDRNTEESNWISSKEGSNWISSKEGQVLTSKAERDIDETKRTRNYSDYSEQQRPFGKYLLKNDFIKEDTPVQDKTIKIIAEVGKKIAIIKKFKHQNSFK